MLLSLTLTIVLVFGSHTTIGQDQILVERLSVNDGLSQSDIRCMTQDAFGFLWIGTRDGLNRYDGHTFERFQFDNKTMDAIGFTEIHALAALKNGNVVAGSVGGISIFDYQHNKFHNYRFDREGEDQVIVRDILANGDTLLLATTAGVISFNVANAKYFKDDTYKALDNFSITQLKRGREHEWIGTTRGLHRRNISTNIFSTSFLDTVVNHINVTAREAFVSTNRGLYHLPKGESAFKTISLLPSFYNVMHTRRAANGEIWVASDQVLILTSDGTVSHVLAHQNGEPRSLSEDRARVIYETTDGVMWIGTFGYGLNKHNPETRKIEYIGSATIAPLSSPYVSAIYSSDDNNIYVGTSRGLDVINVRNKSIKTFNPFLKQNSERLFLILAMKADDDGKLWVTSPGGLYTLENDRLQLANDKFNGIIDLIEYDSKSLLLITRVEGSWLFDKENGNVKLFTNIENTPGELLTAQKVRDEIWIGGNDGIRTFDLHGKLLKHYSANMADSTSLSTPVVKSIYSDSSNVWIGTWGGGLSRYNHSKKMFESMTITDGLPSNVVYGTLKDEDGNLWMSTNSGISVFDPGKRTFRNFDVRDGLQSNEFNTGAYYQSASGKMYFGGINGLNSFRPEQLLTKQQPRSILSKGIMLDENGATRYASFLNDKNHIDQSWHANGSTLYFTVIDFKNAHRYRFQYTLNNDRWRDLGPSRRLDLTSLAPGRYTVKLRAAMDRSIWGPEYVVMTINVTPPFWRQPIFILGLIVFSAGIMYAVHKIRIKNLLKRNQLLDSIVEQRTREVQQKNEEISSQNEELLSQTEELSRKNNLLEEKKGELEKFQAELEQRVIERTNDIQNLNSELIKQNRQLQQFSFITAHNFKGPIARIKGLIQLLAHPAISGEEFQQIRVYLTASINDLDSVTSDLNTILHIRSTSAEDFKCVEVRPALQMVLDDLRHEIESSGLVLDLSDFELHSVLGAAPFIYSVFYNLVENATKYRTQSAIPTVLISCHKRNGEVKVEFADNGIGIDMSLAQDKMFHIYQRFNYEGNGRGLGLYMVRTQMEMMNGDVKVESELGVGTKFILTFQAC